MHELTMNFQMSGNPRPCPQDGVRTLPIARQPKGSIQDSYESHLPEEVLYLEKIGTLSKQSYLQIKHVYTIPLSQLVPFGAPFENRLCEESYISLMNVLNLETAPWIQTTELESGPQDPSTMPTTLKAGLTLIPKRKIITPMAAFMQKAQKSFKAIGTTSEKITLETPLPQPGKGKKHMATGKDFLNNMVSSFA